MNMLVQAVVFAFTALQIFTPKISVLGVTTYAFTLPFALLCFIHFATRATIPNNQIFISYLALTFYQFTQGLAYSVYHRFFDIESFLLLFKYSLPLFLFMFVQRYYHLFNYKFLNSVYRSQILFCVVVVTYVLFNMFTSPMDLVRLSGEYSQTHRFIGFTGHLYENSKITQVVTLR